ncbi:unnamed protein product [Schistosoma mattheei]|uniref:Uncharacterized protein n=1 Tax=Schistosoma mattheei TaxID=31246 RepID=A0A183NYL8_9TREM|nr:unnamed protein product [Schistosoma mattheei]
MDPESSKHPSKQEGNHNECYAPTNGSNNDGKDQLYERRQSILAKCSGKNLTIMIEDLNPEFGIDNTGYEDIMGRNGLEEKTKMGKDLQIYVHSTYWS